MTRWLRWILCWCAAAVCGVGLALGPAPAASAAPGGVGFGTVLADLGLAPYNLTQPGFSPDARYYAFLVPAGDRCDLHLYDVSARAPIALRNNHVLCDSYLAAWAGRADTLTWRVNATAGDITAYAWDAASAQVSVLAPDAHVYQSYGISADGRFLAFTGRSDAHPAPAADAPRWAYYVFDRTTGVSLPLSREDLHVNFQQWGPAGHHFVAQTGGRTSYDQKTGGCLGSGSACQAFFDELVFYSQWSRDGAAVIGEVVHGGGYNTTTVDDFSDFSVHPFPSTQGTVGYSLFVGAGAEQVLGYRDAGGAVRWDRRSGSLTRYPGPSVPDASPTGGYLLYRVTPPGTYRYQDLATGASVAATYRGSSNSYVRDGFWTRDGSAYLGVGPGGCSSLRQWSPTSNTVSLFGPPALRHCYFVQGSPEDSTSASSRFAVVNERTAGDPSAGQQYLVDLRRHVLSGPLDGYVKTFAPTGPDLVVYAQYAENRTEHLLLVDPTPAPDVDDKPRWSAATPANGARIEAAVGDQVQVELGASDLQQTPVNLFFRWRNAAGDPIASAPRGWTCERKRLGAGATRSVCTFAPPKDHTDVRFVDVWAVNYVTGAQSDTRSYRVSAR